MQAITTADMLVTEYKEQRIRGNCSAGKLVVSGNDEVLLNCQYDIQKHRVVALRLAHQYGWLDNCVFTTGIDKWGYYQHLLIAREHIKDEFLHLYDRP